GKRTGQRSPAAVPPDRPSAACADPRGHAPSRGAARDPAPARDELRRHAHDPPAGAGAARARAPDLPAPRPRDVRGGAVDRLRHPPAPPLRRGPLGQGRARHDAAPCHAVLDSGPTRRRRARPRARRAGRLRSRLHPRRPLPHHAGAPLRRSGLVKILVAVKQVPDTATQVKISADPRAIDTTGITWIVSPYDEFAVEEALRIKEKRGQGEVVAVCLGPDRAKEALRSCLAMGCDRAIHLNDPAWTNADTLTTARALAAVIK